MGDLMGSFGKKSSSEKMSAAEILVSCEERYMKLLRTYQTDIAKMEAMMEKRRA